MRHLFDTWRERAKSKRPTIECLEERIALSYGFGDRMDYMVGGSPQVISVGAFRTGSTVVDMVVSNPTEHGDQVLRGKSDGTFRRKVTLYDQPEAYGTTTGDFDGDGNLDVATAGAGSKSVGFLLGNGDGTFRYGTRLFLDADPVTLGVGDFNNDGKVDLATANYDDDSVSIFLGNGDATFGFKEKQKVGESPRGIPVRDLNGDGHLDLAVANEGSANVSILLGNGDGTFAPAPNIRLRTKPFHVQVGDFNGDNKPDLAVTAHDIDRLLILLGNGDGTFSLPPNFNPTSPRPKGLAVADFDLDGNLDVAVSCGVSLAYVAVHLGNGDGTFQTYLLYTVGASPGWVSAGDFDNDGYPDLASANSGDGTVTVLHNEKNWVPPMPPIVLPIARDTIVNATLTEYPASYCISTDTRPKTDANPAETNLEIANGHVLIPHSSPRGNTDNLELLSALAWQTNALK